ncbi:MAG: WecB/TagA/CpsF family glycosyltransferase [Bacteroidales bacterium]|jgi:N-acetylglucosaminyldiphosphoundecaprenol N-acetyl-beta-D-mannosaminyltransferase|nr:WecB/TagA/CpsF family glycosyltransferase [Bacteroidales bacterium]
MNKLLSKTWTSGLKMGEKYEKKILINTINSHSFNVALKDIEFYNALLKSDILIPDGIGIVFALRFLKNIKIRKIAAYDLMIYEFENLNKVGGKCFFLGSSDKVLDLVKKRAAIEYPNISIATYSPPYKPVFSEEDNKVMIQAVNEFSPEVLFVGMTAPKQEKWSAANFEKLNVKHVGCIGATFDFYAGTVERAPEWMVRIGMEWLYRLIMEPKRLWKRYIIGNPKFIWYVLKEKFKSSK